MRRVSALLVLTLLLFSLFGFSLNIEPVKGYETIYIRPDGSIDPSTASILTSDNITYSFSGDINGSIMIERDNIVLDGAGFTLHGSGSGGGVSFSERNNITIKNIEIELFDVGIFSYNSSNIIVSNNNIMKNYLYGIGLKSCSNCTISENTVANNTNMGIVLWNFSHSNVIRRNDVMGNVLVGIEVSKFSSYNTIEENQVAKNHWGIFIDNSTNNEIIANDIMNCDYGVSLYWLSTGNTFYHNNFSNSYTSHVEIVYILPPNQPNIWDNGYPSGGNYWGDYEGEDFFSGPYQNETGSDGIGDSPYFIDANNQDDYPLLQSPPGPVQNLNTGQSFLTIQEAINNAGDGDTLLAFSGTYIENVVVNRSVSLIGENRETTIIDGNQTGTCVTIEADNVTITGFKIQNSTFTLDYYLIAGFHCSGIQVLNNYLWSAHYKILLENCSNCVIEDNYIPGCWKAITLSGSNNNNITNNLIFGCTQYTLPIGPFYGIYLENSHANFIEDNTISDCDRGVELVNSKKNTIRHNLFCDGYIPPYHPWIYLSLTSADETTIVENLFEDIDWDAWWCALEIALSDNCTIYHNDFMSPQPNMQSPCINYWDDGYSSGGNYWAEYNGTDNYSGANQNETGTDGIGDVPYIIDGENRDHYPLMKRYLLIWDITGDGYVGIDDIIAVAEAFGMELSQFPDYQPKLDITRDGYIGIDDIVAVAEHFGETS